MAYEEFVERRIEMAALSREGWSLSEIGSKYGITRQAVSLQLKKAAEEGRTVSLRHHGTPSPERQKIIEYRPSVKKTYHCLVCRKVCPDGRKKTCGKKCHRKHFAKLYKEKDLQWSRQIFVNLKCHNCGKNFNRTRYLDSISQHSGCVNHYCGRKCYESRGSLLDRR
jgi:hypothetical protein